MRSVYCLFLLVLWGFSCHPPRSLPNSRAYGTVSKGRLENGVKLPYSGSNFRYFSPLSYFLLNRAYLHDQVYTSVMEAYAACHKNQPERRFRVMECSKKQGGRMRPHRTHQNGLSVDFMTPLVKNGKAWYALDRLALSHYLLTFDQEARWRLNPSVSIDYETMARHLLALETAARNHGLYIKKVIFKVGLQAKLFETPSGKRLKRKGIYFVHKLSPQIDNLHDEHYHVDFAFL